MQKVRGHSEELPLFVGKRFQVLFHPPLGVLFTFPSRYLFTIGHRVVLSLGGGSPHIPAGFHVPHGTRDQTRLFSDFVYRGITFSAAAFHQPLLSYFPIASVHTPDHKTDLVWAVPRSLAATKGVSFDFLSSRYLDVSVPWVDSTIVVTGFPHSEISGSKLACQFPEAYRRLLRLSSSLCA